MKIKRYEARDMRHAMQIIKADQGDDAVILSNRPLKEGIEVITALDYDSSLLDHITVKKAKESALAFDPSINRQNIDMTGSKVKTSLPPSDYMNNHRSSPFQSELNQQKKVGNSARMVWSQDPIFIEMQRELKSMRDSLQQHLDTVQWDALHKKYPDYNKLLNILKRMHISSAVALKVIEKLSQNTIDVLSHSDRLRALLNQLIQLTPSIKKPFKLSGAIALVGPHGVGKTLSLAKMAVMKKLEEPSSGIVLVCTDSARIGAFEQLKVLGDILGVDTHKAYDHMALKSVLSECHSNDLILIDTGGNAHSQHGLSEQISLFKDLESEISTYLVLSGDMQTTIMDDRVRAYACMNIKGLIMTKMDMAIEYGSFISLAIKYDLPLLYLSSDYKIQKCLKLANAKNIVRDAYQLSMAKPLVPEAASA